MVQRLPYSIRLLLESARRHLNHKTMTLEHVRTLEHWQPNDQRLSEVPLMPARIILQDYTGVPLLADLAAMRDSVKDLGLDPKCIEPQIPVDFIVDHSLQTNHTRSPHALALNSQLEFERNKERYQFIKWGDYAFNNINVFPPGVGIIHQLNLEVLVQGIIDDGENIYPDTVVGTDSHTSMVNGLGIVGWGVGGIEAEAAMLGMPVYLQEPDVIGVKLIGEPQPGISATDILLKITQILRQENVVGKIIEYFGEGASALSVQDRCTIANMAPDYGATMGLFYVDEKTLDFYRKTGRTPEKVTAIENYYRNNELFDLDGDLINYTKVITVDLRQIQPCIAGPCLPSQYIPLNKVRQSLTQWLKTTDSNVSIKPGDILIAAITSCTNTSNPALMITAGLLAQKAIAKGLNVNKRIKTSMTPGSLVVSAYLERLGLNKAFDQLGFHNAGYGCATCAGNVGELAEEIEAELEQTEVASCSVLSGNRNFEARIHPKLKGNFLMSPALVIAYAIAGNININLEVEPIGVDAIGQAVFLKDIWPSGEEVAQALSVAEDATLYKTIYQNSLEKHSKHWEALPLVRDICFPWDAQSTYIAKPPFVIAPEHHLEDLVNARALLVLGDSITTDHISPAGKIIPSSSAGNYLTRRGIQTKQFNSFGSRRGHHEVMMRGAFSNVQLRNKIVDDVGSFTIFQPEKCIMDVYSVAMKYQADDIPVILFAGEKYGIGSSRDWAAKGTRMLGIKAVIAESFERIHRSNLLGMGVLPCQLPPEVTTESLKLTGEEIFNLVNIKAAVEQGENIQLEILSASGDKRTIELICCLNTPAEVEYFKAGGILPFLVQSLTRENCEV